MNDLPKGWAETTIGDAGKWGSGGTPKSDNKSYYGGSIPWIRSGDLPDGPIVTHEISITEAGLENSSAKWVPEGAVLIAMYGATIGKLGITTYPVTTNQAVAFCMPNEAVEPRFLFHGLAAKKQDLTEMGQGGAQPNISQQLLKAVEFQLPPLPEQRRIVAKVDGLTARTAHARKELDRIPTLIARYKQRLLALAFSGELTGGIETWRTAAIGDLADTQLGKMLDKAKNRGEPTKYLRNINVRWYDFELDDVLKMPMSDAERIKFSIKDGDILTCEGGEPGRSAIWNQGATDLAFQKALIRIRPNLEQLNPAYLVHYLKFLAGAQELERYFTGSTIKHLPQRALQSVELPVPPIEEQYEIVRRIESAFGWLDRMAADHAAATSLLPKLDAAILGKAFQGNLVPQDPNDEPAAKLLERVKAEQEADAAKPKKGRGRPRVHRLEAIGITTGPPDIGTATLQVTRMRKIAAIMSKSRQDDDVEDKPYLAGLLKSGRFSDAQSLFRAADLPVADFYKQLAWEIDKGHILDNAEELKAA